MKASVNQDEEGHWLNEGGRAVFGISDGERHCRRILEAGPETPERLDAGLPGPENIGSKVHTYEAHR